jgi:hypothetical protein
MRGTGDERGIGFLGIKDGQQFLSCMFTEAHRSEVGRFMRSDEVLTPLTLRQSRPRWNHADHVTVRISATFIG